ncbi:hypothetical protein PACTADRAFT_37235 [Pachysolen tannophilus NRRL Y-2460]|uniref:1,3-beta-glucanosyltransferase n=1 Tax=Pachysolen tannophilus NRRL Y-2460 TaxID=669874 RepID=A0A1E4U2W7_PACTA|nr:hypothetical protein PACTADRAFT_37235 [Pachysolen tannophilus NRRL Y-2460]
METPFKTVFCFFLVFILFSVTFVDASVHPIAIQGRFFVDTVTSSPFYIKGVDYQPGGSSGVTAEKDPLSNPETCTRDIILFQELGINTIRVYSVNPDLNHDKCMTLLANAGIYLVLDVNSPLENQNLNRYEPWKSYNAEYLNHIFKIVEQFSYYNNTLAFFAGNEVVNDRRSAKASSTYVKAVIRDLKNYIQNNSPRSIPVGYSAADDLHYRIPLAKYLECEEENAGVDFYGVNSYQWCGYQNFHTSGYSSLVEDYRDYTKPIFFSEYGCNEVQPRIFQEVSSLYSKDMTGVFSGGLVYEFSQEPNNYGLVEIDEYGNARVRQDFEALKNQFKMVQNPSGSQLASMLTTMRRKQQQAICEAEYDNIEISSGLPYTLADEFIEFGVTVNRGKYIPLTANDFKTSFKIFGVDGRPLEAREIKQVTDLYAYDTPSTFGIFKSGMYNNFFEGIEDDELDEFEVWKGQVEKN